jgi:DNA-binding winged helix-turn-helix (wHTH) protein
MNVNSLNRVFRHRSFKLFTAIVVAGCTIFSLAAFVTDKSADDVISRRVNIAVRAIGHGLLLRTGDSTSLIRPVVEKSKGVFLLQFENEFVFHPDILVAIAQQTLKKTGLTKYAVTVYKCQKPAIVYGFEINPPDNSIEACRGRIHPKACYNIEIAFADYPDATTVLNPQNALMISGILSMLSIAVIATNLGWKKSKPRVEQKASPQNESNLIAPIGVTIGRFVFDTTNQTLKLGEETISLTDKECKILTLLNRNIGNLTSRDELIQEVWTDEGVITGRSLDMFISKLRKKLSGDPDLRITNVHGKGYKLEIVSDSIE